MNILGHMLITSPDEDVISTFSDRCLFFMPVLMMEHILTGQFLCPKKLCRNFYCKHLQHRGTSQKTNKAYISQKYQDKMPLWVSVKESLP